MKVSSYQMYWIVTISSIVTTTYLPIHLAVEQARQDSWISMLLGGVAMLFFTWISLRVCRQHEDKTLITLMKDLLGTVMGKILVLAHFLLWFRQMSMIAKGTVDFQNLVLLHNTPMIFILICLLFLVVYAVYKGGITAISRCAEIIGPILLFMLFVQLFLNPQDMNVKRILPVYADSGWLAILSGTFNSYSYIADPTIVLMLYFFAENKRTAARAVIWGTVTTVVWGVLATFVLMFVTGPQIASQLVVPIYSLTKYISILNFIQNIDAFYIPLWLLAAFIKLSVCLFILSYGLSEWIGYRNWKLIACIVTCLWCVFYIYSNHNIRLSYTLKSLYLNGIFYPIVYLVLPLILWILGSVKQRRKA
ncbi:MULTISPECIES: endospore germination permease [unclassified Paenibacillus]|uniref:GerAB/ArcD/ProY family transporter n=1 Tax=unclassified Paenibacillus TaxID=185978 RepID=UPI0010520031|nr:MULTISPECIES: endospore germination permease [unclassified Paenibacillus]NIK71797.1 spore germination protein KB [Paenibacillus sp. BK720]TCM96449.1 spore germination protein (amino acid permease) [Paenibacillus sp. BK033]